MPIERPMIIAIRWRKKRLFKNVLNNRWDKGEELTVMWDVIDGIWGRRNGSNSVTAL